MPSLSIKIWFWSKDSGVNNLVNTVKHKANTTTKDTANQQTLPARLKAKRPPWHLSSGFLLWKASLSQSCQVSSLEDYFNLLSFLCYCPLSLWHNACIENRLLFFVLWQVASCTKVKAYYHCSISNTECTKTLNPSQAKYSTTMASCVHTQCIQCNGHSIIIKTSNINVDLCKI